MATINKYHKDALKEVENIGAGKASASLSKDVRLTAPKISFAKTKDMHKKISGPNELVVGIYSNISSGADGTALLVFPAKSSLSIVDILQKKKKGSTKHLGKSDLAKLGQLGKILSETYVKSMSSFLALKLKSGKSKIISTFGASLSDLALAGIKEKDCLLLKSDFEIKTTKIKGQLILILGLDSVEQLISSIEGM